MRQAFLGFLAARPDAMWRSCAPGHLTASALVDRPDRAAGAADPAPARAACGCRSAGTANRATTRCSTPPPARPARRAASARCRFDPAPLGLDVHPITCSLGVPTRHFDVRYLAVAPPGAEPVRSDESLDLRWFAWDALPDGRRPRTAAAARGGARAARAVTRLDDVLAAIDDWPVPHVRPRRRRSPDGVLAPRAARLDAAVPARVGDQAAGRAGDAGRGRGGAVELDDPADEALLPGATLRHLLAHASGLAPERPAAVVPAGRPAGLLQRRHRAGRRDWSRPRPACRSRRTATRRCARRSG